MACKKVIGFTIKRLVRVWLFVFSCAQILLSVAMLKQIYSFQIAVASLMLGRDQCNGKRTMTLHKFYQVDCYFLFCPFLSSQIIN